MLRIASVPPAAPPRPSVSPAAAAVAAPASTAPDAARRVAAPERPTSAVPAPSAAIEDAHAGRGYIRVGPSGRYLQRADGTPFFSIGHGEGFGFYFEPMNPPQVQDSFLAHMRKTGQNTVMVQLENEIPDFFGGHRLNLEGPAGTYDEKIASQFDRFLDRAAKHDVHVMTYIWDTFHMSKNWDKSPYNVRNGGPARYPSDMLREPAAIDLQHRKIDWFMKRYGNHPNLFAVDLMNEIDWGIAGPLPGNKALEVDGRPDPKAVTAPDPLNDEKPALFRLASHEEIKSWVDNMSAYARDSWRRHWGDPATGKPGTEGLGVRPPLLTVGTNNPDYIGEEGWLHRHPDLDLATVHMYSWADDGETTDAKSPRVLADATQRITRTNHSRIDAEKPRPFLDTENGPLGNWLRTEAPHPDDRTLAKVTAWAEATSGAAGTGMRWPYPNYGFAGHPHLNPLSPEMEQDTAALAKVVSQIDWNRLGGGPRSADQFAASLPDTFVSAVGDPHQMFGYLARDNQMLGHLARDLSPTPTNGEVQVRFGGLAQEPHEVRWFDTASGAVLRSDTVTGSSFTLKAPDFGSDIAVVVRPQGTPAGS